MRLASLLLVISFAAAVEAQVPAPPPDPRAEALNEEGKVLYLDRKDYAAAVARFRAAIAIRRDARYSYNLCAALEKLGQPDAALAACEEVPRLRARPELIDKAARRADEIRRQMAPPAQAPPAPPQPDGPQPPKAPDPYAATPGGYGWSLGADAGLVHNATVGYASLFSRDSVGLRLHGDFVVAPSLPLYLEPYLDLESFGNTGTSDVAYTLTIVDLGLAVVWQGRIWENLYFTPAAGLSFSAFIVGQPDSDASYGTIGIRADVGFEWLFGGGRHALAFVPAAVTIYAGARGQLSGTTNEASKYGLDAAGATFSVFLGYRYRFPSGLPILF